MTRSEKANVNPKPSSSRIPSVAATEYPRRKKKDSMIFAKSCSEWLLLTRSKCCCVFTIQQRRDASEEKESESESTAIQMYKSPKASRPSQQRSSAVVYWDNLLVLGQGSPIWLPDPSSNNAWFHRHGVSVGDVGLLLPTGGFLFLFNICYPKSHPINLDHVPDCFAPLERPIDPTFMTKTNEEPGYSLTSRSVDRIGADLLFKSSSSEGAILALPSGMHSEDLFATQSICDHIANHLVSWYRYVIHEQGCQVDNGDIRVVTGFSKTSQWGVAAFSESSRPNRMRLQPRVNGSDSHVWDYSGSCNARSGPPLSSGSQGSATGANQCVFLRTVNATFSEDAWNSLKQNMFKHINNNPSDLEFQENIPMMKYGSNNTGASQQRFSGQDTKYQHLVYAVPNVSSTMMRHPSKLLNDFLWDNAPAKRVPAQVIITSDSDWISVLKPDDLRIPSTEEIYRRLMDSGAIVSSDKGYMTFRLPDNIEPSSNKNTLPLKKRDEKMNDPQSNDTIWTSYINDLILDALGPLPNDPTWPASFYDLDPWPAYLNDPIPSNASESSVLNLLDESLNDLMTDPQSNDPTVVQTKLMEDVSFRARGISTDSADDRVFSEAGLRASLVRRTKPAKFHCDFKDCNASFTRNAGLKNHYKSHLGVTDLECPFCGTRMATSLNRHKKRCRQNPDRVITSTSRKPREELADARSSKSNPQPTVQETLVPGSPV